MTSSKLNPRHYRHYVVHTLLLALLSLAGAPHALALKSDADQPATINADDVELDFKTGERIYIGNVFVRQGSMELTCDKLVATFKDDKLAVATAYGNADKLAVFKQRPEGKPNDVVGKAVTMILDQIEQLVTLSENASLNQGTDTVTGQKILYDMELEKMRVKGSQTTIQKPTGSTEPASNEPANAEAVQSDQTQDSTQSTGATESAENTDTVATTETAASAETEAEAAVTTESAEMVVPNDSVLSRGTLGRPRMIIQPRSKRNPQN